MISTLIFVVVFTFQEIDLRVYNIILSKHSLTVSMRSKIYGEKFSAKEN